MLRADIAELKRLNRIHRAEYDTLYFMTEYFSEDMNAGNPDNLIPSGVTYENSADFHRTLCGLLDDITSGKQQTSVAWSVGRGFAKTAYLSNGYLCHNVVYRHKRYIVEVSETTDVAGDFIQWTRNQLCYNDKLREDFGELLQARKSLNEIDNKYEFVTSTGTKVEARGAGTQVRGLRHGAVRPELFLLDDLESRDNTNTTELIEKNKAWFREELLPALSKDGIAVYMGTILCSGSLLDYVIRERRDFISRKFPAILKWSEREDLWEKWRSIYRSDDTDASTKAHEFYEENAEEMTQNTEVLWAQRYTYLDLMKLREENGTKAFNQEYLGNPVDTDSQIFKPEEFVYYVETDLIGKKLQYFCGIDIAMGKEKGDYSAIITLGRNVETGVCYVVDVFLEKANPDVLLEQAVIRALKYEYEVMSVEAQQMQEWWAEKLGEKLQERGYPAATRMKQIKQRVRKQLRIESLLPDMQNGKIRFLRSQRLLLDQFELYDGGKRTEDDGPDALHMAYSGSKTRNKRKATSTGAGR